jgi:outer membrane receptor protein involved in Fe transport
MKNTMHYLLVSLALIPFVNNVLAQENTNQNELEEVVVIGSQLKGASITGALPVTVISSEDIEALGVDSGDELLAQIAENGANYYNEQDWNGGVNGARGDVGSFNIRNLGTGNTLALINGRRLVQNPSYQTEAIGGSFVPVMSVNSNNIRIGGVDRVEILKDGASAIY